jgi:glyoxylate/hydroxypyruvate reductase A
MLTGELSPREYELWRIALRAHLPPGEALVLGGAACADESAVEVALVANPPRGELAKYPNLRFIQSLWAGVDRLLGDPTLPENIPIARLVDPSMAQSMVESVVAATLFVHRQFPAYLRQQQQAQWHQLPQTMASRCNVTILGYGQMGRPAASALAALGFPVAAWGQHERNERTVDYASGPAGLQQLLRNTRILVNLLPLTRSTAGILNARLFEQLPRGAALINLGRGRHLNEEDLLAALRAQRLEHAVLDVFREEPLPPDHPFWSHPHVTVLPHVAASTDPESAAPVVVRNIAAFRAGEPVTGLVTRALGY